MIDFHLYAHLNSRQHLNKWVALTRPKFTALTLTLIRYITIFFQKTFNKFAIKYFYVYIWKCFVVQLYWTIWKSLIASHILDTHVVLNAKLDIELLPLILLFPVILRDNGFHQSMHCVKVPNLLCNTILIIFF